MKKSYFFLPLVLAIHILVLVNIQFTSWPEMLVYPYLLKRGFHFYTDIIHPYLPTLPYTLFYFFSTFGFTVLALQGFTLALVVLTDILIFFIAKKLFSAKLTFFVLILYIMLQVALEGNGLWFDNAVTPFALSAFYCVFQYLKSGKLSYIVLSGLLLGTAFTVKQTSFWYVGAVSASLVFHKRIASIKQIKQTLWQLTMLGFAFLIPFLLIFPFFDNQNVLFWGILFPFTVMPRMPGYILYPTIKQIAVSGFVFMPIILMPVFKKNEKNMLLFTFFLASLGFLIPRFAYFHLQPTLPFFVLSLGIIVASIKKRHRFVFGTLGIYALGIAILFALFFIQNAQKPPRFFESHVLQEVSQLKQILSENEPVFFYNTPGNYIVAGNFLPVKPWSDTFSWYLEVDNVQEKIIDSLEYEQIDRVVLSSFGEGNIYDLGSYRPALIDAYIDQNFSKVQQIGKRIFILQRKKGRFMIQ